MSVDGTIAGVHTNGGCAGTNPDTGFNIGQRIGALQAVSPILTNLMAVPRFILQTRTALQETPTGFDFAVGPNGDVFAIQRIGTGTGTTEVHVLRP